MENQYALVTDFTCPFCFWQLKIIKNEGVNVQIIPFELRPEDVPSINLDEDLDKSQLLKNKLIPQVLELGHAMKYPDFAIVPRTKLAWHGFYVASSFNKGFEFYELVSNYYWQQSLDISDLSILVEAALELGIKEDEFLKRMEFPKIKEAFYNNSIIVKDANITAVPLRIINGVSISGVGSYLETV